MEIWLIIPFGIFGILMLLSGIKNLTSYRQFKEVEKFIDTNKLEAVSTKNVYYSSVGQKKDYPSYPTKTFLVATENDIVVFGINSFPFIFKTYLIPFIVSIKPEKLTGRINVARIFKLDEISVRNKSIDFKFKDRTGIQTTIEYQMNFKNEIEITTLMKLKKIESELKILNDKTNVESR